MEGGYQIIDLKNKPLSGTPTAISGVLDIISNTKKPVLVQNVVVKKSGVDTPQNDFFSSVLNVGNGAFTVGDLMQDICLVFTSSGVLYTGGPIDAIQIPINNTLEVDGIGLLGVASA